MSLLVMRWINNMKIKKKNKKFVDDGHTVYDMSIFNEDKNIDKEKIKKQYITKKETHALIKAGFLSYLPYLIACIVGFGLAILVVMLWLK